MPGAVVGVEGGRADTGTEMKVAVLGPLLGHWESMSSHKGPRKGETSSRGTNSGGQQAGPLGQGPCSPDIPGQGEAFS